MRRSHPKQIATLVYGNLRLAQYHLLRLHRSGLLERTAIVDTPSRAEYAYRVSPSGHQRLGTRRTPAPATYVRHMLDTVDAVCNLNRSDDREHPPVHLWLADSMTGDILGRFVRPDSIAVVTTEAGSAVLALEIDEATEHARTIRAKLAAYRRPRLALPALAEGRAQEDLYSRRQRAHLICLHLTLTLSAQDWRVASHAALSASAVA